MTTTDRVLNCPVSEAPDLSSWRTWATGLGALAAMVAVIAAGEALCILLTGGPS